MPFFYRRSIADMGLIIHTLVVGYILFALQVLLYFGFLDGAAEAGPNYSRYTGFVMWLFFIAPPVKAVGGGFAALRYKGTVRWLGVALLLTLLIESQFLIKALCTFVGVCWATPEVA